MTWKPRLHALLLLLGTAVWSPDAVAISGQYIEKTQEICAVAAKTVERRNGIPRHLLAAISLVESGRYDAEQGESFAWPWTVTAEGKGRYFATKEEAKVEVEVLLSQGIKNIDVGCMQINLHYHWEAFATLDAAFDPEKNAAYAAKFLKSKYAIARNWLTAAGQYHSHTPENFRPYRIKVLSFWNRLKRDAKPGAIRMAQTGFTASKETGEDVDADAHDKDVRIVAIDQERSERLNGLLREKRRGSRLDMRQLDASDRRLSELDDWRDRRRRGVQLQATVVRRLAEMNLQREEKLRDLERTSKKFSFADKRRQQLERWRDTGQLVADGLGRN